ncbi:MAG: pyridoxamine 5'-phosphate oxidase family protein [Candidatus Bathyarchaeia archaeon]
MDKEIESMAVIEEILMEQEIGRLGTCHGSRPYVVPLNYGYRDGKIFFHSFKEGKKMRNLTLNPEVCFEVDIGQIIESEKPCDFSYRYRSVIAYGHAKVIKDEWEKLRALTIIVEKYSPGKGRRLDMSTIRSYPNLVVVEIDIKEMTGKSSPSTTG